MNYTIFDLMYPKYKITKPIRLIEFFAGYGSQALALKYLNINFEHYKICEWAIKSIQAYKDLHYTNDPYFDNNLNKEDIVNKLFELGISSNYNTPMTKSQINKLSYDDLIKIYQNILITKNLVNIQKVHAKDLKIYDTDKYDYILTYSFPCQDLSLAGKGKGMSDTSTRSGMLWEVERILTECKSINSLPNILLMENVPQVHSQENVKDFNKWFTRLEELGYKNYFEDLSATDYGIPQTRVRCFMISILGDYNYTFPRKEKLKLKLKDFLEEKVDNKYFLSDKMIKFFYENEKKQKEKGNGFRFNVTNGNTVAKTITTRAGGRMDDNYIGNKALIETLKTNDLSQIEDVGFIDSYNRNIKNNGVSGVITTRTNASNNTFLAIKNATKKGYLKAYAGDGIDLCQPNSETRRGRVQKNKIQTLTTQNNVGVVNQDLRIRKLTPKECFRLMGVKDEDFEKIAKNQSNSSLYHLAGDSIVVNVLMAIFKELL